MSVREIDIALEGLELNDKIGALILALCARNVDAIAAIGGLAVTAGILASNLKNEADRRRCATCLRDIATEVEHEHRPLV
jgi:hypothetical protein